MIHFSQDKNYEALIVTESAPCQNSIMAKTFAPCFYSLIILLQSLLLQLWSSQASIISSVHPHVPNWDENQVVLSVEHTKKSVPIVRVCASG